MDVISVKNLSYVYGNKTAIMHTAVNDVSFSVEKGDFVGIIGHTGSGKSTLVQMLNGLIKPTKGEVYFEGVNIWDKPKQIRDIRFKIGLVFQYPEYQLFEETVYKDICFGPINMGLSGDELKQRVLEAADFVGLSSELLNRSPFELSGGEKRRVAIAGVIAMKPEVLILDEPAAGLDPMGKEILLTQIYNYHKHSGTTVLLVSHSMEDIARVANRVIVMNKSNMEMYDTTDKIFADSQKLQKSGLEVPQITRIMNELRKRGYPFKSGILTVEEAFEQIYSYMKSEGKIC